MMRAWGVNPRTTIKMIAENTFLIQFTKEKELQYVINRGLWNYREDVIAIKRVQGPEDLEAPKVDHIEINTQWHHIPTEAVKKEGVRLMAEQIGQPISEVTETCVSGNRVYKVRMLLPLDKPLKDSLEVNHPTMGVFKTLIVYERVNRICLFCGNLGHENTTCADRNRMQRLKMDPRYMGKPGMEKATDNKVGTWINNQNQVPIQGDKRDSTEEGETTKQQTRNESGPTETNPTETAAQNYTNLGVDLNMPSQQQKERRARKGKATQMQVDRSDQQMSLKRMGPAMEENERETTLQITDGVTEGRLENDEWYTATHVNKKRAVEVSGMPPPQAQ